VLNTDAENQLDIECARSTLIVQIACFTQWNRALCRLSRKGIECGIFAQLTFLPALTPRRRGSGIADAKKRTTMKKFEAVLPLFSAQRVIEQLGTLEIDSMITTHVTVIDKQKTRKMIYRGFAYDDNSSAGIKVEVNVSDRDAFRAKSLLAGELVSL
jgi:hypothetical protein